MKKFVQFWDKFSIWFYILWLIAWIVFMVMFCKYCLMEFPADYCIIDKLWISAPFFIYGIVLEATGTLCRKFEYKHKIGYYRSTDTD